MSSATALDALPPLNERRSLGKARRIDPGSQETCLRPQAEQPSWKGVAHIMKLRITGLAALALACASLAPATQAATFTVTVRVEGQNQTLLPTTPVTLDTAQPGSVHLTDADCDGDT